MLLFYYHHNVLNIWTLTVNPEPAIRSYWTRNLWKMLKWLHKYPQFEMVLFEINISGIEGFPYMENFISLLIQVPVDSQLSQLASSVLKPFLLSCLVSCHAHLELSIFLESGVELSEWLMSRFSWSWFTFATLAFVYSSNFPFDPHVLLPPRMLSQVHLNFLRIPAAKSGVPPKVPPKIL